MAQIAGRGIEKSDDDPLVVQKLRSFRDLDGCFIPGQAGGQRLERLYFPLPHARKRPGLDRASRRSANNVARSSLECAALRPRLNLRLREIRGDAVTGLDNGGELLLALDAIEVCVRKLRPLLLHGA